MTTKPIGSARSPRDSPRPRSASQRPVRRRRHRVSRCGSEGAETPWAIDRRALRLVVYSRSRRATARTPPRRRRSRRRDVVAAQGADGGAGHPVRARAGSGSCRRRGDRHAVQPLGFRARLARGVRALAVRKPLYSWRRIFRAEARRDEGPNQLAQCCSGQVVRLPESRDALTIASGGREAGIDDRGVAAADGSRCRSTSPVPLQRVHAGSCTRVPVAGDGPRSCAGRNARAPSAPGSNPLRTLQGRSERDVAAPSRVARRGNIDGVLHSPSVARCSDAGTAFTPARAPG